jgi:hypothetical protein
MPGKNDKIVIARSQITVLREFDGSAEYALVAAMAHCGHGYHYRSDFIVT